MFPSDRYGCSRGRVVFVWGVLCEIRTHKGEWKVKIAVLRINSSQANFAQQFLHYFCYRFIVTCVNVVVRNLLERPLVLSSRSSRKLSAWDAVSPADSVLCTRIRPCTLWRIRTRRRRGERSASALSLVLTLLCEICLRGPRISRDPSLILKYSNPPHHIYEHACVSASSSSHTHIMRAI